MKESTKRIQTKNPNTRIKKRIKQTESIKKESKQRINKHKKEANA